MNVGVVGNARYEGLPVLLRTIAEVAARRRVTLYTEAELRGLWGAPPPLIGEAPIDALLTLGGDGTLLRGACMMTGHVVPVLGVNLGRVGFLTAATRHDWQVAVEALFSGRYQIEDRLVLQSAIVCDRAVPRVLPLALNDVVIHKSGVARMIRLERRLRYLEVSPALRSAARSLKQHLINKQSEDGQSVSCFYCSIIIPVGASHLEHRRPLSRGGTNRRGNLVLSCSSCNLKKGRKTHEEFMRELGRADP